MSKGTCFTCSGPIRFVGTNMRTGEEIYECWCGDFMSNPVRITDTSGNTFHRRQATYNEYQQFGSDKVYEDSEGNVRDYNHWS